MGIINAQLNTVTARSRFQPGSKVLFGQPGEVPDPENPATLKVPFIDKELTLPASPVQGIDSDSKFEQSSDGNLYGTGQYSIRLIDRAGTTVYYLPSVDVTPIADGDFGTAAYADIATTAQAIAGTAGVLPDAEQVQQLYKPVYRSLAAMKAAVGLTAGQSVYMSAGGRSGDFEYVDGDFTAEVASDTLEGVYVKLDGVAASVGVLRRVLNGFVTPEMFGADGTGYISSSSVFNSIKSMGLTANGVRSSTYLFDSDVQLLDFDGNGCTLKTVDCSIRLQKGTGNNVNTIVGNFKIDDSETTFAGDGCFVLEKGDMWRIHTIDARGVKGTGRKGLVIRPFEDFAWIENATFEHVKFSSFDYPRYVDIPNFVSVFANQFNFINCEFRNSGITGMYVDTSATTAAAQKVSAWSFIGDEFDGGGQSGDDLIFLDTSGGAARVEAWSFIGCALEDTITSHSGYCVNSNDWNKVTGLSFIGIPRYNYLALVPAGYTDELLNTLDAQSPNCQNWRISNPTVTNPDADGGSYSGFLNLYTGKSGGTSSFAAGETKTALTVPDATNYREYELVVHPAALSDFTAAQIIRVIAGPGGAVAVSLNSSSVITAAMSGAVLQLTNTDSSTKNVRFTWRYLRSSE